MPLTGYEQDMWRAARTLAEQAVDQTKAAERQNELAARRNEALERIAVALERIAEHRQPRL